MASGLRASSNNNRGQLLRSLSTSGLKDLVLLAAAAEEEAEEEEEEVEVEQKRVETRTAPRKKQTRESRDVEGEEEDMQQEFERLFPAEYMLKNSADGKEKKQKKKSREEEKENKGTAKKQAKDHGQSPSPPRNRNSVSFATNAEERASSSSSSSPSSSSREPSPRRKSEAQAKILQQQQMQKQGGGRDKAGRKQELLRALSTSYFRSELLRDSQQQPSPFHNDINNKLWENADDLFLRWLQKARMFRALYQTYSPSSSASSPASNETNNTNFGGQQHPQRGLFMLAVLPAMAWMQKSLNCYHKCFAVLQQLDSLLSPDELKQAMVLLYLELGEFLEKENLMHSLQALQAALMLNPNIPTAQGKMLTILTGLKDALLDPTHAIQVLDGICELPSIPVLEDILNQTVDTIRTVLTPATSTPRSRIQLVNWYRRRVAQIQTTKQRDQLRASRGVTNKPFSSASEDQEESNNTTASEIQCLEILVSFQEKDPSQEVRAAAKEAIQRVGNFTLEVVEEGNEDNVQQVQIFVDRLVERSPYFKTMLEMDMLEQREKRIRIITPNPDIFLMMIDYLYTHDASIIQDLEVDSLLALLLCANQYGVEDLVTRVMDLLTEILQRKRVRLELEDLKNMYDVSVALDLASFKSRVVQLVKQDYFFTRYSDESTPEAVAKVRAALDNFPDLKTSIQLSIVKEKFKKAVETNHPGLAAICIDIMLANRNNNDYDDSDYIRTSRANDSTSSWTKTSEGWRMLPFAGSASSSLSSSSESLSSSNASNTYCTECGIVAGHLTSCSQFSAFKNIALRPRLAVNNNNNNASSSLSPLSAALKARFGHSSSSSVSSTLLSWVESCLQQANNCKADDPRKEEWMRLVESLFERNEFLEGSSMEASLARMIELKQFQVVGQVLRRLFPEEAEDASSSSFSSVSASQNSRKGKEKAKVGEEQHSSSSIASSPSTATTTANGGKRRERVRWQWKADSGWQNYDKEAMRILEKNYRATPRPTEVKLEHDLLGKAGGYVVRLSSPTTMQQVSCLSGFARDVQRTVLSSPPSPPSLPLLPQLNEEEEDETFVTVDLSQENMFNKLLPSKTLLMLLIENGAPLDLIRFIFKLSERRSQLQRQKGEKEQDPIALDMPSSEPEEGYTLLITAITSLRGSNSPSSSFTLEELSDYRLALVSLLLKKGAGVDVLAAGRRKWTPLMFALWEKDLVLVQKLLNVGADPIRATNRLPSSNASSPTSRITKGDEIVRVLEDAKVTPLMVACGVDRAEDEALIAVVKELLEVISDTFFKKKDAAEVEEEENDPFEGNTALMLASHRKHERLVRTILQAQHEALPKASNKQSQQLLCRLLGGGLHQTNLLGWSALHFATAANSPAVVRQLLNNPQKEQLKDSAAVYYGGVSRTALDIARNQYSVELVGLLSPLKREESGGGGGSGGAAAAAGGGGGGWGGWIRAPLNAHLRLGTPVPSASTPTSSTAGAVPNTTNAAAERGRASSVMTIDASGGVDVGKKKKKKRLLDRLKFL
ncbi:hypothetical protein QOT17_009232 [Balamuthia mandrillaris]